MTFRSLSFLKAGSEAGISPIEGENHDREPWLVDMVIDYCPLGLDKGIPV
jgi:hypothetical protein